MAPFHLLIFCDSRSVWAKGHEIWGVSEQHAWPFHCGDDREGHTNPQQEPQRILPVCWRWVPNIQFFNRVPLVATWKMLWSPFKPSISSFYKLLSFARFESSGIKNSLLTRSDLLLLCSSFTRQNRSRPPRWHCQTGFDRSRDVRPSHSSRCTADQRIRHAHRGHGWPLPRLHLWWEHTPRESHLR